VEQKHMPPPHAAVGDRVTWHGHWTAQGQPWRVEQEIDAERRAIEPDIAQGIYPFKDLVLSRADVEWLLATHEDKGKQGPVDASDLRLTMYWESPLPSVREQRVSLDLRGADLSGVDLSGLPLARTPASLAPEYTASDPKARRTAMDEARVRLTRANLHGTHLEQVLLVAAIMDDAGLEGR
jgi:hypothetical protein